MASLRSTVPAALALALGLGAGTASAQLGADIAVDMGVTADTVKDGGVAFADFDGDGWLDLVVNANGRGFLFASQAGASFMDVTDARAPALRRSGVERSVVAADLNNDGYVDLVRSGQSYLHVLLNRGPTSDPPFLLGAADGTPDFFLDGATDPDLDAYEGVGVLDLDGDGYLDIAMDNDAELRVYVNGGDGASYTLVAASGLLPANTTDNGDYIAVTDWDVDGLVDIAHRQSNAALGDLFHNEGGGTFAPMVFDTIQSPNSYRGSIVFCDIDNDGDFDFFYSSGTGTGVNHFWVQGGDGSFVDSGQPVVGSTSVDGVACGDLDNDGDADLYLSRDGEDYVYLNQLTEIGSPVWTRATGTVSASENGEGVAMADFDRDGDLDVYVNQWGGTYTDPTTMETSDLPADNALLRNDTGGTSYLAVEILAEVQSCPGTPVFRSDIGAVARVELPSAWQSGVLEVNGGEGHGSQGSPILHFGLPMGASQTYVLTVHFQHGDEPDARLRVTPSALGVYQLLTVRASDPDADDIPSTVERAQAAMYGGDDVDGDGFVAWNDDDADGDGVPDAVEAGDELPCTDPVDTNANGVPDYLEVPASGDAGPGFDAGLRVDGGAGATDGGPTGYQAHGSGCMRCAVSGREDRDGCVALAGLAAIAAIAVGRARRRALS